MKTFLLLATVIIFAIACKGPTHVPVEEINSAIQTNAVQRDLEQIAQLDRSLNRAYLALYNDQLLKSNLVALNNTTAIPEASRGKVKNQWITLFSQLKQIEEIQYRWSFVDQKLQSYNVRYALPYYAWTVRYYHAWRFLSLIPARGNFEEILNDSIPEYNIPAFEFRKMRDRIFGLRGYYELKKLRYALNSGALKEDFERSICRENGRCHAAYLRLNHYSEELTRGLGIINSIAEASSFREIVSDILYYDAWVPLQTKVAEVMGDTRIQYGHEFMVTRELIEEMQPHLRPGDIMFIRRNWYVSNVGLPGFWPHAAFYLGTPQELSKYFNDPEVQKHFGGKPFIDVVSEKFPRAYIEWSQLSKHEPEGSFPHRVLEAQSEGVIFTSLQHAAHGDYVGVIRPLSDRYSKIDAALAVLEAFKHWGKKYDFDFNFITDDKIVCTELVYKAWLPNSRNKKNGTTFDLVTVVGRPTLPANEMVKQFAQKYGTSENQYEFVYFIDGFEKQGRRAQRSTLESFLESHKRSQISFSLE